MTRRPHIAVLAAMLVACGDKEPDDTASAGGSGGDDTAEDTGETGPVDVDGDGFDEDADCDDADPAVFPRRGRAVQWPGRRLR
jgi:hypothetical protein